MAAKPDELNQLSAVPRVAVATEVLAPIASASTCPSGVVVSEGDAQLRAAEARSAFGVDGAGTTVGILSDSFDQAGGAVTDEAEDIETGDLPGAANTCPGQSTPDNVLDDSAGGEDEGRAMTQIVHDLAPGAGLAFATAFTGETAFAENIESLAKPTGEGGAGARVIADDVTYFEEPFFQESLVGVAASNVTAKGVSYFSSAANNNLIDGGGRDIASWEAPGFRDAGSCPAPLVSIHCMDFDPGAGTDTTFELTVSPFSTLRLDLQWAEPWEGVASDIDAFLISGGSILASSTGFNIAEGRPFEFIGWGNASASPAHVQLVLNLFEGPGASPLKFSMLENGGGVTSSEYPESSGGDVVGPTIFGHNGGEDVTSVAAIPYDSTTEPESYSSRGPVTHYFGPVTGTSAPAAPLGSPEVLSKPDLTATDCGVTTFFAFEEFGDWRFCGTSAAAPHAAAVAALMLQEEPAATPEQIRIAMQESATAVGAFGPPAVGAGLVDALGAVDRVTHSLTIDQTGSGTGTVTVKCEEGSGFEACAHPLTRLPNGTEVKVSASAGSGSKLTSLTGVGSAAGAACVVGSPTEGTCRFTLVDDSEVTATFELEEGGGGGGGGGEGGGGGGGPRSGTAVAANIALVKGGKALVRLRCRGAGNCSGALRLVVRVRVRNGRGAGSSRRRFRNLVIGKARFSIPAGTNKVARVPLTGKGKRLVRHAGRRGLVVKLRGSGVVNRTVRLRGSTR